MTLPTQTVPYADHLAVLHRASESHELLAAMWLFQPFNLAATVAHLDNILGQIDARLGTLEKRLDAAGIKELPDGIPDDECERYFTLPTLGGFQP